MSKGGKIGKINSAAKKSAPPVVSKTAKASGGMCAVGDYSMSGAVAELARQHPESHSDRGPHHGSQAHDRHKPYRG